MIHKNYTIRFVLHRRSDTARQYLQMRVTPRGGKPVSFATGLSLLPGEWDAALGRAKGRSPEAAEANTLIAQWSQLVANIFSHYDGLNIVPTAEQIRGAFARATSLDDTATTYTPQSIPQMTMIAAYTQFIIDRQKDNSWSQGTVSTLQYFRHLLDAFRPDTPLEQVDESWMECFHQWLVGRKQQGVTVNGNLVKMRWFMKWARRKGLYHGTADQDYRPKVKGAGEKTRAIVYLTRDELLKVEEYEFAEKNLSVAKDVFLFGCYTGLRFSDIFKLTRADCYNDHITFITLKTNHTLTVPLNDKAKSILDKYAGCSPNRQQKTMEINSPALPTPGKKTMNRYLHQIMQQIGIDAPTRHTYYVGAERFDEIMPKYELITTHTARHTFIVTAISLGIHPSVILSWTGHKNYEAMLPYIAIANETSKQSMQLFNNL